MYTSANLCFVLPFDTHKHLVFIFTNNIIKAFYPFTNKNINVKYTSPINIEKCKGIPGLHSHNTW